jgi:hypothetical protein
MDFFNLIKEYLSTIKPSQYGYILPLYDRSELDKLAQEGQFPALVGLVNSLIVATVLGLARYVLTYILIKVFKCMNLTLFFFINYLFIDFCLKEPLKFTSKILNFFIAAISGISIKIEIPYSSLQPSSRRLQKKYNRLCEEDKGKGIMDLIIFIMLIPNTYMHRCVCLNISDYMHVRMRKSSYRCILIYHFFVNESVYF